MGWSSPNTAASFAVAVWRSCASAPSRPDGLRETAKDVAVLSLGWGMR